MELGQLISQYISEHGMSVREFGRISGLSPTQITNYIKGRGGKRVSATESALRKIATAMNITLAELIDCLDGDQLVDFGDSDFAELLELYNQLTEDEHKRLIQFASFMLSTRENN